MQEVLLLCGKIKFVFQVIHLVANNIAHDVLLVCFMASLMYPHKATQLDVFS